MIKVSRMADYAILLMCKMANNSDFIYSAHELSIATLLPITTISKILTKLTKAEILNSVRGVSGGYKLLRSAKDISVGSIIDVIEGKVALTVCVEENNNCDLASMCPSYNNWHIINDAIRSALNSISIADMNNPIFYTNKNKMNPILSKFINMEN